MSKKTMIKKSYRWILTGFIIIVLTGSMLYIIQKVQKIKNLRNQFEVGGDVGGSNKNIEMLNKLNDNWTLPEEYILEVFEVDGITMEWIKKEDASPEKAILQLHGGAYSRSLKDNGTTYRRAAVQYAQISGAGVLTVDYRVAPENPFPAALEDAVLAYFWLLNQGY